MPARLFGTDGVRGVANGDGLSPEVALALGRASALYARERGADRPVVVVGRDTRRSGPMLEDALCAGIAAAGGLALRAGVLPTPGIAWLVREQGASLGAVISASHNAFPDNGIKQRTLAEQLARRPEEVIRHAVRGMLPKNRIGRAQLRKLKVYAGTAHPHDAQQPTALP